MCKARKYLVSFCNPPLPLHILLLASLHRASWNIVSCIATCTCIFIIPNGNTNIIIVVVYNPCLNTDQSHQTVHKYWKSLKHNLERRGTFPFHPKFHKIGEIRWWPIVGPSRAKGSGPNVHLRPHLLHLGMEVPTPHCILHLRDFSSHCPSVSLQTHSGSLKVALDHSEERNRSHIASASLWPSPSVDV